MDSAWGDLPEELLLSVLRFLPLEDLASEAVAAAAPAAGGIAWPSGSGYKRKPEAGERPSAAAAVTSDGVGIDWRERFKAQFVEQGRRQRLRRQARRLKADSALAVVRQEVHRLEAALAREQRELPLLQAQLVAVQRARQQASAAVLSQRYWLPVAVQQAHGVVTGQTPQDAEGREAELRQHVVVAELELRKLGRQLAAKRAWEAEARRRLAALQP
ncbi:hypothetical protein CHLNCDRAFT_144282 [Chlorella variabilis]|uniref:F-box domain-containing protein n=1 Tax=Chlorella variabilis TaxID=554065 RepID=E1ZCC3_CHLVA|nr:hypothetical protein CHLNCDRAFT_144282 [Chlorella variabilis]EFN56789.1 hypothetical protein CHLNCDRAFT_144282 [Chlorella variabilis]|eukprot:XP_005848891.1 hypothetical protein CHLNCDRAFT_144282 [Chlorella variabilis]